MNGVGATASGLLGVIGVPSTVALAIAASTLASTAIATSGSVIVAAAGVKGFIYFTQNALSTSDADMELRYNNCNTVKPSLLFKVWQTLQNFVTK